MSFRINIPKMSPCSKSKLPNWAYLFYHYITPCRGKIWTDLLWSILSHYSSTFTHHFIININCTNEMTYQRYKSKCCSNQCYFPPAWYTTRKTMNRHVFFGRTNSFTTCFSKHFANWCKFQYSIYTFKQKSQGTDQNKTHISSYRNFPGCTC